MQQWYAGPRLSRRRRFFRRAKVRLARFVRRLRIQHSATRIAHHLTADRQLDFSALTQTGSLLFDFRGDPFRRRNQLRAPGQSRPGQGLPVLIQRLNAIQGKTLLNPIVGPQLLDDRVQKNASLVKRLAPDRFCKIDAEAVRRIKPVMEFLPV